jgi:membrane protein DedA with SNARE-associated domain
MPGFLNALAGPLNHYGYWAILALVMIEDFGIPVPGETILIAGAIYAGHGQLNVVAVGAVAFLAAVIGDNIGFAIGHFGGRELALRWGRYVFLTEERLDKAEGFFERHGGWIITFARFIEGLRQANGIVAGITGMHWRRFLAFNALGAALWVGTWVSLGYFAGNHINTIYHYITQYSLYVLIALAVLLAGYITRHVLRRRRRRAGQARQAEQARQPAEEARQPAEEARQPADIRPPTGNEPPHTQPTDGQATGSQATGSRPTDTRPAAGSQPNSTQPNSTQPASGQPSSGSAPVDARRFHQGS